MKTEKLKKNTPMVSVVISHYNLGDYLYEALDSSIDQTLKDFEIIVVDDGSVDPASIRVVDSLNKKYPEVILIKQKNLGLPTARNNGIKAAKGQYIVCLDADDKLHPDYLEKLSKKMISNKNLGIVTSGLKMFDQKNNTVMLTYRGSQEILINNGLHVASMFKKSAWERVGGYKSAMGQGYEDWEFWISIIEFGYEWDVVPEPLFYYRVRKTSMITESRKKHKVLVGKIFDLHKDFYHARIKDIVQYSSEALHKHLLTEENLNLRIKELNNALYLESKNLDSCKVELEAAKSQLSVVRSELDITKRPMSKEKTLKIRKFFRRLRKK